MSRLLGALCIGCFAACAEPPVPRAPAAKVVEPAPASGPVIGPAMAPAEKPVTTQPAVRGELMPPQVFPAAKPSELGLASFVPGAVEASLRERFALAEGEFLHGNDRAAEKAFAALPKSGALTPWLALAKLRLRARTEDWPTSVGGGDRDSRVASAIATLHKLDLRDVPATARGPFLHEQGRWLLVHGDYQRARGALEVAAQTLGEEPETLSLLGLARLASGEVAAALDPIERATALDLGSAARWGNLGTIRMMNGKINEAARAYEARVRLAPNDAQGHADLGIALVQLGEHTRGRAELQRATELEPDRASFLSNLAYAQHRADKRGEARATYQRALAKEPTLLVALLGYSALLSENPAELPEARRVFERAEKLAPDDPRVLAAKSDLAELEKKH